jgi:phospholipid/cholesterol/gamma-HCH transport system ATP-binding protein
MAAPSQTPVATDTDHIVVTDLSLGYGDRTVQKNLNFAIRRGDIFIIMGGSGCGKSTVMRTLIGLVAPKTGSVIVDGRNLWEMEDDARTAFIRRFGALYQSGALWSSMTLAENVALALEQFTTLSAPEIRELVALKLALVGLAGFEDFYPSEISGGMRKRAGLARAMALDPEVLFFDEPSAGLDPISSHLLDELILELRDSLGATVVMVTHELPSIFAIGTNSVFLDAETKTQIATGNPTVLLKECADPKVRAFLTRGAGEGPDGPSGSTSKPAPGPRSMAKS